MAFFSADLTLSALNSLIFNVVDIKIRRNNADNVKFAEKMPSTLKIKEFNVDGIISVDLKLTALNSLIFNVDGIISADFNVVDIKIRRNSAVDVKSAEIR